MSRGKVRGAAAICALTVLASGCYTGAGRAESRRELLKPGMSQDDVRDLLGEPDAVAEIHHPEDPGPIVEWSYVYGTPFTMHIVPTVGLFTIVLSVPSFYYLFVLGMASSGRLRVEFGPGLRLLRAVTDPSY